MCTNYLRLLCTAVISAAVFISALAQEPALVVTTHSGGKVVYALKQKPTVTFTTTDVVLRTDAETVSYPLSDHVQFTFETSTAIEQMSDLQAVIVSADGKIQVSHVAAGTLVGLYTVAGMQLQLVKADASGNATLDVTAGGVYVVQVGKMSIKFSNM
ncbi:MAG: hypothetical protein HUK03_03850 [Bacteroidaceae bacterium]|nr:hypothetical protein [Bacteroidaceae bacterium]